MTEEKTDAAKTNTEEAEPKQAQKSKTLFLDNVRGQREVKEGLTKLMNEQGVDVALDTPDFVLGNYLLNCLNNYEVAIRDHRRWSES